MGNVDEGIRTPDFRKSSSAAMYMRKKNAVTALQDSIAAADVRQMPTISMEIY